MGSDTDMVYSMWYTVFFFQLAKKTTSDYDSAELMMEFNMLKAKQSKLTDCAGWSSPYGKWADTPVTASLVQARSSISARI